MARSTGVADLRAGETLVKSVAMTLFLAASLARPAVCAEFNLIFVVMDTVRADHCSLYGSARATTPRLAELAAKGLTFDTAIAQSDWTIPAHASMFTGRRPLSHGVLRTTDRLGDSDKTLAQLFQRSGFKTAAFTGAFFKDAGLTQGFELLRNFSASGGMGSLSQSMPEAVAWLERASQDRFFVFIHGADAHTPYVCPKVWRGRFAATLDANSRDIKGNINLGLNPMEDWLTASPSEIAKARSLRSEASVQVAQSDQYDGCLAYGDEQLATLSAAMTRLGLWDNTLLVVTADHGEEFAEHGGFGHLGRPLHEEIGHVPLVIVDPQARRVAGQRTTAPFEQIDFLPTIADIEGWPLPAGVEGRSEKAILEGGAVGERVQFSQAAESESGNGAPQLEAMRLGNWKALRTGTRWELFDLTKDPKERETLLDAKPEIFLDLAAKRLALEPR
jgi:arylsulfatase A-like enzyme